MENKETLILSQNDVQLIVSKYGLNNLMDQLISRLSDAIKNYDPQNTVIPIRSGFNYEKPNVGLVEWMPLYNEGKDVSIKVVGYHPNNPNQYQLPTILSTVSVYDTATGHLEGLMDGVLLTALRTGASSAIASKCLAHPESETLGLIGCGAQAVTQMHALSRVFKFKKILIYDTDVNASLSLSQRTEMLDLDAEIIISNIETIVNQSDILCTATSIDVGKGPLFEGLMTKPHLHINAVGSDFPGKVELPMDILEQSFVCPDFLDQAVIEGECQRLSEDQINEDWVQVIQNASDYVGIQNQRSVFDSTGWALEDYVAMRLFMEYAAEIGVGQKIQIEDISGDVRNPYHFLNKKVPNHR